MYISRSLKDTLYMRKQIPVNSFAVKLLLFIFVENVSAMYILGYITRAPHYSGCHFCWMYASNVSPARRLGRTRSKFSLLSSKSQRNRVEFKAKLLSTLAEPERKKPDGACTTFQFRAGAIITLREVRRTCQCNVPLIWRSAMYRQYILRYEPNFDCAIPKTFLVRSCKDRLGCLCAVASNARFV